MAVITGASPQTSPLLHALHHFVEVKTLSLERVETERPVTETTAHTLDNLIAEDRL